MAITRATPEERRSKRLLSAVGACHLGSALALAAINASLSQANLRRPALGAYSAAATESPLRENVGVTARLTTLFYDYVEGMLERRGPHREAHLAHIARWSADGRLAIAGALGDPPTGALFVFEVDDPTEINVSVAGDPYVRAELVVGHRVAPWNLVASRHLSVVPPG